MGDTTQTSNDLLSSSHSVPAVAPTGVSADQNPAETDLWIFRDGKINVSGPGMIQDLAERLAMRTSRGAVDALIQAGELEAGLADASSSSANAAAQVTDALASRVCGSEQGADLEALLVSIDSPASLAVAPPEGFTYYALHPADFAAVTSRIPREPRACAVIGIRSIGTTLSAMTVAALRRQHRPAARITARPTGHPYSRVTQFSAEELRWIRKHMEQGTQFLVVDEGPGRSGSTFLSVAEALQDAGVPTENITMIGSRQADPESLCAHAAVTRWRKFRFISTLPSENRRFEHCHYVGGGAWREVFLPDSPQWPESWTQMERLKFISPDQQTLFKFEGMGRIGAKVRERAFVLADAGFSPRVADEGSGFLAYSLVHGRRFSAHQICDSLLDRIARYCAFRAASFPVTSGSPSELGPMLEHNVRQEFGIELRIPAGCLAPRVPVLCDGRMQPYEWLANDNHVLKVDAIDHGDNHFFPGPCDIAWDIAGTAVEWQLGASGTAALVEKFRRFSGIDVSGELPFYLVAYLVFRLGFCKMALSGTFEPAERQRLRAAYQQYRYQAERLLAEASEHAFAA